MTGYFHAAPRPLHAGDEESVRPLVHGSLGGTPYVDRVVELLPAAGGADPEIRSCVVERDGTVAALALFGPVAGARGVWKLHIVLLAPRIEPREVGRAVMEHVVELARREAARMLVAELPADAAYGPTLSLLRSNDFDQDARIPDFFRDDVALLFLRKAL